MSKKLKKPDKFESYIKVLIVIESCNHIYHIISSYKMIQYYRSMFKLDYDDLTVLTLRTLLTLKQDKIHNDEKNQQKT
jgi:hypothetical protein